VIDLGAGHNLTLVDRDPGWLADADLGLF